MKIALKQRQRILVGGIYFAILIFLYKFTGEGFESLVWGSNVDSSIWFYSGAFLIILGAYITEPFFTRPADAIANSIAVLIALISISDKDSLFAYQYLICFSGIILGSSIVAIFLKDSIREFFKKSAKALYWFSTKFGNSKVIFSSLYLSATYSYFAREDKIITFISILAYWVCLVFFDVVGICVREISKLLSFLSNRTQSELGQAIGCENPLLYNIEIDYTKPRAAEVSYGDVVAIETGINVGSVGIVVNVKHLLKKRWVSVYLLKTDDTEVIKFDLKQRKLVVDVDSIYSETNLAYLINIGDLDDETKNKIINSDLYKNKQNFLGYVTHGSNINIINFFIFKDFKQSAQKITEGSILKTFIYGEETLYQVIDGNTREERLENFDKFGYTVGVARKLGQYVKDKKELSVRKWMPQIYAPVFFAHYGDIQDERLNEIANSSIGRLPETDLEVTIKNPKELITHNTAILGILGIGKSCLAFELIKKISDLASKVVCIDITNEYEYELQDYECSAVKPDDTKLKEALKKSHLQINKDKNNGGNHGDFRIGIKEIFKEFIEGGNRILIMNPEEYDVSVQTNDIKPKKVGPGASDWEDQAPMRDLTVVEITRIISEVLLEIFKEKGRTKEARCLIVFEEAHSLVPEWNSVADKADEKAVNGTAKVILQGRKYGLGVFLITQRTANVSKSILNQCNTIFALRVFDDTGKVFLENYIGEDYANTLPTLEERHAVVIGRGLKLKQPVIIRLNERKNLIGRD